MDFSEFKNPNHHCTLLCNTYCACPKTQSYHHLGPTPKQTE